MWNQKKQQKSIIDLNAIENEFRKNLSDEIKKIESENERYLKAIKEKFSSLEEGDEKNKFQSELKKALLQEISSYKALVEEFEKKLKDFKDNDVFAYEEIKDILSKDLRIFKQNHQQDFISEIEASLLHEKELKIKKAYLQTKVAYLILKKGKENVEAKVFAESVVQEQVVEEESEELKDFTFETFKFK